MTTHNRYEDSRRRPLRLRGYDYTRPGAYFVTICTHRRVCLFGRIVDGAIHPNAFGAIVDACWRTLPEHYPHVGLDAFVVMPNHVHGILVLAHDVVNSRSTRALPSRHGLPEIVRAFKTFSSRRINEQRYGRGVPVWQRGYYEHIIRNETSLREIESYIETNPLRWNLDRENPKNAGQNRTVGAGFNPAPTCNE